MNLIWRLWDRLMAGKKKRGRAAMTVPRMPDQGRRALEAQVALGRSRATLNRVNSNEEKVDKLHQSMRRLGEQNGFAALILRSLGGGGDDSS